MIIYQLAFRLNKQRYQYNSIQYNLNLMRDRITVKQGRGGHEQLLGLDLFYNTNHPLYEPRQWSASQLFWNHFIINSGVKIKFNIKINNLEIEYDRVQAVEKLNMCSPHKNIFS